MGVGKMGVGKMGVGEQGISPHNYIRFPETGRSYYFITSHKSKQHPKYLESLAKCFQVYLQSFSLRLNQNEEPDMSLSLIVRHPILLA